MSTSRLVDTAHRVLAPTYRQPDLIMTRGEGCWLEDADGNRYLDMTTGSVTSLGHDAAVVREALEQAAGGLIHTSNLFYTQPAIDLAERLVEHSFAERVFFCNSGAEAVEGALKFARLTVGDRHEVVYFDGSFHGRTFGALSATDRDDIRTPFEPLVPGFRRAPYDDDAALTMIDERTAAVIVEPIQGEGGVRTPRPEWLQHVRQRCAEVGALMIVDEIQCGLGRTGNLWAHQISGIKPDLLTLAKPLAGGLPMGAVLLGERAAQAVTPGSHGSTFGGGPVVATVACAVFDALSSPDLLSGVTERAALLRETLNTTLGDALEEVRGVGLIMGLKFAIEASAKDVAAAAREQGLLVVPASGDVLRFLPPLDTPHDDLREAVQRLGRAIETLRA